MAVRFMRRRRRRRRRRRAGVLSPLLTVARVKKIAIKAIGAELKVRDLAIALVAIPTITGSVVQLTDGVALPQGDAVNQRSGNWIQPTFWSGHIVLQADAGAVPSQQEYTCAILQWNESEADNPCTLAKIFDDVGDPFQGYNIQSKGQFRVLWSRKGILSTDVGNPKLQKYYSFNVKVPKRTLYSGAADRNGHLFLVAYSNIAAAANPPLYRFSTRLRYTDS